MKYFLFAVFLCAGSLSLMKSALLLDFPVSKLKIYSSSSSNLYVLPYVITF